MVDVLHLSYDYPNFVMEFLVLGLEYYLGMSGVMFETYVVVLVNYLIYTIVINVVVHDIYTSV